MTMRERVRIFLILSRKDRNLRVVTYRQFVKTSDSLHHYCGAWGRLWFKSFNLGVGPVILRGGGGRSWGWVWAQWPNAGEAEPTVRVPHA